jgi:hypothetical protein
MDLLRDRMLYWWKKRVTSPYFSWLKNKHPRLRGTGAGVIEGRVSIKENAEGDTECWWRHREEGYPWKPGGQQEYKKWWRDRFTRSPADWSAGRDSMRSNQSKQAYKFFQDPKFYSE